MITDFLVNKFVDKKEDVKDKEVRREYGNLASLVGLICNISLAGSKIFAGLVSNSVSILGDGINQLTDTFSSIVALVSFKISKKPADKKHPFGHARYEYILSSIVSLIVAYVGIKLLIESIDKIRHPGSLDISILTIVILTLSILVKLWMYIFYMDISKRINSDMLKATAIDAKADVFATGAILISTLLYLIFKINIDSYIGILVSLLIIKSGIELIGDVVDKLVGIRPDRKKVYEIESEYLKYERILNIHNLMFHDYGGNNKYITLHVEMDSRETLQESHALIDKIEKEIKNKLGVNIMSHVDPVDISSKKTDFMKEEVKAICKEERPDLTLDNFRVVEGDNVSTIMFQAKGDISYEDLKTLEKKVKEGIKRENEKFDAKIINDDIIYGDDE